MSEGLITRLGQWVDRTWQDKATEAELLEVHRLINQRIANIELLISKMDLTDVKTRLEKIELYSGMTRKVDPTRPPIVKSAFSM